MLAVGTRGSEHSVHVSSPSPSIILMKMSTDFSMDGDLGVLKKQTIHSAFSCRPVLTNLDACHHLFSNARGFAPRSRQSSEDFRD